MKPADARSPTHEHPSLPATVAEIGKIHFEGNIIPHPWYQQITLSGKADLPAITILAKIVYWYRPYQTLDKRGKPLLRKRFDGDTFQCTAAYFESKFGLTKDQVRKALKRLEDAGYIRREYRSIVQQGILRNNIMFIEPAPATILSITNPAKFIEATAQQATPLSPVGDTLSPVGDTLSPTGDRLSPVGDRLSPVGDRLSPVGDIFKGIKITTETTTEITTTTPNPFSTNEHGAEPDNEGGGGGLIFDFDLADLTPEQRERARKTLAGLPPALAQQVLDEWNHAHTCRSFKQTRWGWLRKVAETARSGQFAPSAELADRRQAPAPAPTTPRAMPPERRSSALWREQRGLLRGEVPDADYNVYIAPLRGCEDAQALWLEAPNRAVAEWVNGHLPLIEGALRPHTPLPVRVCIG